MSDSCYHFCSFEFIQCVCVLFVLCKQHWLPWKQEYHCIVMNCKHDSKVSDLALSEQAVLHEAGEKEQ